MENLVYLAPSVTSNLLKAFVGFVGPLVAIGLIIFVCVQAYGMWKGSSGATLKKLLGGIMLFFIMLGAIFVAASYKELETSSKTSVKKVVDTVNNQATDAVDGRID